jgi:hypothetical protein
MCPLSFGRRSKAPYPIREGFSPSWSVPRFLVVRFIDGVTGTLLGWQSSTAPSVPTKDKRLGRLVRSSKLCLGTDLEVVETDFSRRTTRRHHRRR